VNAFPQELRSKRIYRIAGGYVVSAWLVLQVASVIAPSLSLPAWTLRALLGILLLGFSVALFAGWRLDVRAARASKLSANFHLMVWPAITLFLLGGVILVVTVFAGAHHEKTIPAATGLLSSKSVAVLPFESLSDNKSDTYFADGVQDEILSNLAKVSELKVISRTSVMTYRPGGNRDLRSIATALGVANVVEGTVRRNANRVRVTTELIDARTDQTLWSDSYDRDLTDIFAIQSEIAQTVASKLSARLSPGEKKDIEEKPTDNLEAYDLYLQANQLIRTASFFNPQREDFVRSLTLLEEATQKDPRFALAYCSIALTHDGFYLCNLDRTAERRALGDAAVKEALHLRPDLPEAHLAAALHLQIVYRDFEKAREQIAIAAQSLPNNPDVFWYRGATYAGQGRWEEAIKDYEQAILLDPRYPKLLEDLVNGYWALRRFRQAEQTNDRLIELMPDEPALKIQKAYLVFVEKADLQKYLSVFETIPASLQDREDIVSARLQAALFARDWTKAREILSLSAGENFTLNYIPDDVYVSREWEEIWLSRLQEDSPAMEPRFEAARDRLKRKVEQSPGGAGLVSALGMFDAALGQKQEAIQEARRAVEMVPITKDAELGPGLVTNLAIVYAWLQEPELAIRELTVSVNTPGGVCYGELAFDPFWDPLRKDPRFDKLLAQLAPKE
jgi:TolB-like protein/Tfp pilus assembly protein PilF